MSKMKVQDATKELSRGAAKLLSDVASVRQQAEKTLAELRKIENGFMQQEEAQREEKRREEQEKALKSQSKAWTMPDDVPAAEEKKEAPQPAAAQWQPPVPVLRPPELPDLPQPAQPSSPVLLQPLTVAAAEAVHSCRSARSADTSSCSEALTGRRCWYR